MKLLQKLFQIPKPFIRHISRYHISFWFSTKYFLCLSVNTWTWGRVFTSSFASMSLWQRLHLCLFSFITFFWRKQNVGYWFSQIHGHLCTARAHAITVVIDEMEAFVDFSPNTFCMSLLVQRITYQFLQWGYFFYYIWMYLFCICRYICVCIQNL